MSNQNLFGSKSHIASLKNLVVLYGGTKSYEDCKSEKVSKTMHEFNDRKLKDRGEKIIKNKKQAIAIALSQVESKCKYNPEEKKSLINKVNDDLKSDKELNLTNLIETKKAIEILQSTGKYKKIYILKNLLFNKIIKFHLKYETMGKNMWTEIKNIQEING